MIRYFLKLCFVGTQFHGWQRQPTVISIQSALESVLTAILNRPISCHGCGRTDRGVHAKIYYAHLDLNQTETDELIYRANRLIGKDIRLLELTAMPSGAHAQLDAIKRTYIYDLHLFKNPFIIQESTWYPAKELNLADMQKAANALTGFSDFLSFCKTPAQHRHTNCKIMAAQWVQIDPGRYQFVISADHFLRGMIRLLVGNMLEIGLNQLTCEEFVSYLENKEIPKYFRMAPPQGLHLAKVLYPYEV